MKAKKSLIYVFFVLFLFAAPVYATNENSNKENRNSNQKQQLASEQKCKSIESKIKTKTAKFSSGKLKYFNSYNNLKNRLIKFEKRLSAKGYDTTKLKADIDILIAKIDKFSADYSKYINTMNETKNYACEKSDPEFRSKLEEARIQLKQVHADSKEIKTFYHDIIRIDLQEIKKQTPSIKQGNSNSNNTNTNENSNTNTNSSNSNLNANTNSVNLNAAN